MALYFISLHVRRITTELYYYEYTGHYTLFPYISVGLQRNYIIAGSRGIIVYFLTCQVDCNEIILLRVDMAVILIFLQVKWITWK